MMMITPHADVDVVLAAKCQANLERDWRKTRNDPKKTGENLYG
jgi:hypothetical protein